MYKVIVQAQVFLNIILIVLLQLRSGSYLKWFNIKAFYNQTKHPMGCIMWIKHQFVVCQTTINRKNARNPVNKNECITAKSKIKCK